MRISIVMTHHDRLRQLYLSLRSLCFSKVKDFEVVIVDDGSPNIDGLRHVCADFPQLNITTVIIRPEDKWWINPCIPYNMGFKEASGDIIVIQNPECFHFGGDILEYIALYSKQGEYLSFPCYSTTQEQWNNHFFPAISSSNYDLMCEVKQGILPLKVEQWYNHPAHQPTGYHFCSAIHQEDLTRIGGFNEEFADGYCFDDDEFIQKIKNSYMNVSLPPTSYGFVIHQWHPKNPKYSGACPEWHKNLERLNRIRVEKGWK